jgi:prepilin-type N-terminal cleavage/methylation domain-containing protein
MLKNRAGFTLAEVLIALVLTTIIGAAITSVFVTQAGFYDRQEKLNSARGVSRGAMNVLMSEMRMIEQVQGVDSATATRIVLRVPYAMGVTCGLTLGSLAVRYAPTDTTFLNANVYSGYAWRDTLGVYQYRDMPAQAPNLNSGGATCDGVNVASIPSGGTLRVSADLVDTALGSVSPGLPVFLYMKVAYEFRNSAEFPGRTALWRRTLRNGVDEELVAPFGPNARFRFYTDDSTDAQDNPPAQAQLNRLTGIEIVMDGQSERPELDGSRASVPLRTAIFFKNRL